MSADRDVTRIVRSWLDEGVTALPDRVLDAVLDQVPATRQRRAWWPARRFREMNNAIRIVVAAAAVVVVALIALNLMPSNRGVGGPPSIAPTPSPTPAPTLPTGEIPPGTYGNLLRHVHGARRLEQAGWQRPDDLQRWQYDATHGDGRRPVAGNRHGL